MEPSEPTETAVQPYLSGMVAQTRKPTISTTVIIPLLAYDKQCKNYCTSLFKLSNCTWSSK